MKNLSIAVKSLAVVLLLMSVVRGVEPVAAPAVPLHEALKQLTADDYETRQGALDKIQAALAQNIHEMLLLNDPEARGRLTEALEYNAALSRWALDVLALPAEKRTAMADWGTSPEVAPQIAKIYSKDAPQRVKGIGELAKNSNPNVNNLLAKLIKDEDASVQQAAISAARTRPANPAVIDALWDVAMGTSSEQGATMQGMPNGVKMMMGKAMRVHMARAVGAAGMLQIGGGAQVIVRGNVNGVPFGNVGGMGDESGTSRAVAALIGFKDPLVVAKVRAYYQDDKAVKAGGVGGFGVMFGGDDASQNILTLAEAYQVKEIIPYLMKIVSDSGVNTQSMTMNGKTYCTSNRTDVMAAVCVISGQKPENYKLQKSEELNAWTTPDAATEGAAADKLVKWFHSQPAPVTTATQPVKDSE